MSRLGPLGIVVALPVTLAIEYSPGAYRLPVANTADSLKESDQSPKLKLNLSARAARLANTKATAITR